MERAGPQQQLRALLRRGVGKASERLQRSRVARKELGRSLVRPAGGLRVAELRLGGSLPEVGIRVVGIEPCRTLVERNRPGRLPSCGCSVTRSNQELGVVPIPELVAQTQPAAVDVALGDREPGAAGQGHALGAGSAGDASAERLGGRSAPSGELLVGRRELAGAQMLESPRKGGDLGEPGPRIAGQLTDRELDLVEDRDRSVTQQRAELREGPFSLRASHDRAAALDERQTQSKLAELEIRLGEQEMRGPSPLVQPAPRPREAW